MADFLSVGPEWGRSRNDTTAAQGVGNYQLELLLEQAHKGEGSF